jgi:hypothetical protein
MNIVVVKDQTFFGKKLALVASQVECECYLGWIKRVLVESKASGNLKDFARSISRTELLR